MLKEIQDQFRKNYESFANLYRKNSLLLLLLIVSGYVCLCASTCLPLAGTNTLPASQKHTHLLLPFSIAPMKQHSNGVWQRGDKKKEC